MRKLAHIEKIEKLAPINGADKIEVAYVLGWECVVKKGEFSEGDKIIYIEVDSVVPDEPRFEFLRGRKFRVRTIKLRGQVSQGLIVPLDNKYKGLPVGTDMTDELGIKKYLTPSERNENAEAERRRKADKNKLRKFMMRYSWFRRLFLSRTKSKGWPYWVAKTDEERIQNMPQVLDQFKDRVVYVTEKIDCLDENTEVITDKGILTIKDICNSSYDLKVLSYNSDENKSEFKRILNRIIKPNENKQWVKITLEDDTELLVTNDHRIWLPDLQCYRQVKDLTEKDFLLKLC